MIKKPEKIRIKCKDKCSRYREKKNGEMGYCSSCPTLVREKAIEEYDKWLKDKCSVSQLEILILKMGTITRQGLTTSVVSVSSKDLATALHDYLLEREGK